MPAIQANTDAQRSYVATQWKNEIRDFCQQIQTDLRQALSAVAEGAGESVHLSDVREHFTIKPVTSTERVLTPEPTPTIDDDLQDPTPSMDHVQDPTDSTEDRLRKLREQLNNLIDDEDA